MKKFRHLSIVLMVLALALTIVGVAAAADEEVTCEAVEEAGAVEGTVIGVDDEAGTVDVLLEDGSCVTVTFAEGDYDSPIVALLAEYFGGASLEDYEDALDALELEDGTVVSIEEQEDGTWLATLADDSTVVIEDEELADEIADALDTLDVSFDVTADEDDELAVPDVGEEIEAYHDDGYGYGIIVKVYAIAAESAEACAEEDDEGEAEAEAEATAEPGDDEEEACGVTVEELIDQLDSGMGMGQLFKLYGKPALLGVGHVRQGTAASGDSDADGDGDGDGSTSKGVCNAREQGGQANATGKDIECP